MGRSDLPDMYAQARGRVARVRVQTYQVNHDCTCYICYVALPANKNCSALYRQGWCFRLQHLEFNVVMTHIYTKQLNHFNCGIEF